MAKSLEDGFSVWVDMWDVTEGNVPKKYEGGRVWIRKVYSDDFSIWCNETFNYRRLGDGDEIGLYWDPRSTSLVFKLLSQASDCTKCSKQIHDFLENGIHSMDTDLHNTSIPCAWEKIPLGLRLPNRK
ncbi:hypothetical protein MTR67_024326, partial [Solanum verrucosum]